MKAKTHLILLFLSVLFLIGCTEDETDPIGDYLPVTMGIKQHLRAYLPMDGETLNIIDTIKVFFGSDTTIGRKVYKKMEYYHKYENIEGNFEVLNTYKLFRKEGSKYYNMPFTSDTTEHMFLDASKAVGTSWNYFYGFEKEFKTIFTIKNKNMDMTVNGIKYKNVIEVIEDTYYKNFNGRYDLGVTSRYCFAKNVGEILHSSESFFYPSGDIVLLLGSI